MGALDQSVVRFTHADVAITKNAARDMERRIEAAGPNEPAMEKILRPQIEALGDLAMRLERATANEPKFIQIAAAAGTGYERAGLYALDEDGGVWLYDSDVDVSIGKFGGGWLPVASQRFPSSISEEPRNG